MKKLLTITAAASAIAIAAPAAAQWSNQGYANANAGGSVAMGNRIDQLQARLQAGVQAGTITRREAQSIRPQLRQLRNLERQYSINGLTQQERQDLQYRIRSVRQQLRVADGGSRQHEQYGQYDDDNYYGQGGPYEEINDVCERRGGIGGVIDSVLGRDDCNGLRVGQRATGNLYGLPSQYRYQYRDGNGIYYRSDGRQIYQIDARTNTVIRVHDMNR